MNRVRDACEDSINYQAQFAFFLMKGKHEPHLIMLMSILKEIFDKKGKMIQIKKTELKR